MDEHITKWILEFLLRKPIDEEIINGLLSSLLPLSTLDCRLNKTLSLRRIESEISNGSVSEKILDLLEKIEELDHKDGRTASNAIKRAYCAVAVDCTVRFLDENVKNNANYLNAVERVWRNRVCTMKNLFSEELKGWWCEIEAAINDLDVCRKILMRNTRYDAVKAVRVFVTECWEMMGPTILELVASKVGIGGSDGDGDGGVIMNHPCRELVAVAAEPRKDQAPLRRKHVAIKSKRYNRAKISDADEEIKDEAMNKASDTPIPEAVGIMQEAFESCSMELHASESNFVPDDALQTAQTLSCTVEKQTTSETHPLRESSQNVTAREVKKDIPTEHAHGKEETQKVQAPLRRKHVATKTRRHRPPKISDADEKNEDDPTIKTHDASNPKVAKLQEEFEPNSTDQSLSSKMATSNIIKGETTVENQTRPETHPPRGLSENDTGNAEKKDNPAPTEDAQAKGGPNPEKQPNLPRRSLMEPNGTTHTLKWDDSIDNSPLGSPSQQFHLPRMVSKRKSRDPEDISLMMRRVRKVWTDLEIDALRDGVKKHGEGRWQVIKEENPDMFQERTTVDLKDKWRNLMRTGVRIEK